MNYAIGLVNAVVLAVTAYAASNGKTAGKDKKRIMISVLFFVVGAVCGYRIYEDRTDMINVCKLLTALWGLSASACVDFREHRIPNLYPAVFLLSGTLFLAYGCLTGQQGAKGYVVTGIFAMTASAACLLAASYLTKGGIGAGDIKLFSALGLLTGVNVICGTAFFASLFCASVSAGMLLAKKKKPNDTVAFGPFICLGYIITILFLDY